MPVIPDDYIVASILVPVLVIAVLQLWKAYQKMVQDRIKDLKDKDDAKDHEEYD